MPSSAGRLAELRQVTRPASAVRRGALPGAIRGAAAPLIVAVAAQSVGNLLFHAVVGRLLPADEYGALGAVLAALVMLAVPLGALQAAASTLAAERGPGAPDAGPAGLDSARVLRGVAAWSAGPAVLVLVAAPAVQDYFHLASALDAAQLAPYLLTAAVLAAGRGLLLGQRRVGAVAHTYLIGTAARLALGLALAGPYGVSGALAGTLAGEAASLALAVAVLRRGATPGTGAGSLRLRTVTRSAVAVTGLFLFSTVDLLLARHHLRGAESGAYVAAATVAKTALALPAALLSAVFPRLVSAWPAPGRARVLATGAAVVVVPAVAGAAVVVLAPGLVLGVLYGDRYLGASALTQVLASVAALTSVISLLTHAALARRAVTLVVPWAGAALEIVLIELRHGSAAEVATGSVVALVPTLVVLAGLELRAWRRHPDGTTQPGHRATDQHGTDHGPTKGG